MALSIIGIDKIIIVQNKIDIVTREEAVENFKQIKEFVKGTIAEDAPIIPISANSGVNIDKLVEAIEEHIIAQVERDVDSTPLMHIARSFDINSPGTTPKDLKGGVLGGSLIQGTLKVGDEIDWEVTPKDFGRIAVTSCRQAIAQKLKKAEREIVKEEFQDKVGEIVHGTVKRIEAGSIIVDLQKAEGIIGAKEKDKVPGEVYMIGDRINALLIKVDIEASGPSLILSRSNPDFVRKLFEREVSEIHDGVVEIAGLAREAGMRTKIAVRSNDPRVDPVGACVGMRGMRVRNITAELGNERVDIIRYDEDIKVYAANALHPAKLVSIEADEEHRMLDIHVDQENSRLAFGKKAQNVRLAQKLIGWNINFTIDEAAEESFEEKKAQIVEQLSGMLSIAPEKAELLVNNGYLSMDGLKTAGIKDISAIPGLDEASLQSIAAALEKFVNDSGKAE